MESLVHWKKRRDRFQDSDSYSGCGDQVDDFSEMGNPSLTGSPKGVKLIMKDETNASSFNITRKAGKRRWW